MVPTHGHVLHNTYVCVLWMWAYVHMQARLNIYKHLTYTARNTWHMKPAEQHEHLLYKQAALRLPNEP